MNLGASKLVFRHNLPVLRGIYEERLVVFIYIVNNLHKNIFSFGFSYFFGDQFENAVNIRHASAGFGETIDLRTAYHFWLKK